MEKIMRYECSFCKKTFKIDRHFCFKDPKNRACASCDNYLGIKQEINDNDGSRYNVYWCGRDNDTYIIYDSSKYPMTDNIPFRGKKQSRGYDCDWWKPRTNTRSNKY